MKLSAKTVVINLVIINVLVYLAQIFVGENVTQKFALYWHQSPAFRPYQLLTHMFLHGSLMHIFFNMFALYTFGSVIEQIWGPKKFLLFYFLCGFGAAAAQLISFQVAFSGNLSPEGYAVASTASAIGASGAVMGIAAAFATMFPNTPMYIIPIPIPIKAKWLIIGYFIFDLVSGMNNADGDNVAHFAHIGGAITGFLLTKYWGKKHGNFSPRF